MAFGNFVDQFGTALNLPELGISEMLNGGNSTANTGRIDPLFGPGVEKIPSQYTPTGPSLSDKLIGGQYVNVGAVAASKPAGYTTDAYGTGGYYTGGGGTSTAYDPNDMAYLDDTQARLQRQMQSAALAQKNGLTSLDDSYNKEVTGANSGRARTVRDFTLKREDDTRSKDQALQKVNTNARTLADSLRRRIGMASGSGSSAYNITAPGAVAREASQDRTGVVENYGINFRNLGTAEEDAKTDFERYLGELGSQYKSRKSDFMAGVYDQQNNISGSLAEVARQRALLQGGGYDQVRQAMSPYTAQIDSRQSAIDGLFEKYRTPYTVQKAKVNTPQLRDYMVDNSTIQADQKQGDIYSPYSYMPREDDEKQASLY